MASIPQDVDARGVSLLQASDLLYRSGQVPNGHAVGKVVDVGANPDGGPYVHVEIGNGEVAFSADDMPGLVVGEIISIGPAVPRKALS